MVSPTINVVRYTALATGVLYGVAHRRTLQNRENAKREKHEIERKEKLLERAKDAWKAKNSPPAQDLITNPDDPKFDLEKLVAHWEAQNAHH
ncbi:hypothetical protein BOTBODRAFT_187098 [Botryobasidium botryosum FD-172 SS1]|uniref:ATP synthase F(0) complex subunit e, mitochondrial n=1 Tax=Botryobasidium botryosum (strain FD-172 SS1) TaxID=930990 RepID=A0A067MJA4_BOTB1|nr:hypothetical protein BOTBODRAFT_187098 [Botryobasidium botryosum FD-172 SS1]